MKEELCRTAMLIGEDAVKKLSDSSIIIFGIGGVGSFAAEALARAGAGSLTLVDNDTVSLSNINRQLYALHSTVGRYKTEVAKERIKDINPDCEVTIFTELATPDNIDGFFGKPFDFCIDAVDDTAAKTAIALECNKKEIPMIAAMGTGKKLDSGRFQITDIRKTEYCPLCRAMRKKYAAAGLKKVTVLFSPEMPHEIKYIPESEDPKRLPPSSISFIPSSAGLKLAEYAVKTILDI